MKKKVSLNNAKDFLGSEKVFRGADNSSMIFADFGKYRPGISFIIPDMWVLEKEDTYKCPLNYIGCEEITSNMDVDFDANGVSIIFGNYWLSKNGKPMFKIGKAVESKFVLFSTAYGGAFSSTRGAEKEYAMEKGACYFKRASSNGGGMGRCYYIFSSQSVRELASLTEEEFLSILKDIDRKEEHLEKKFEEEILRTKEEKAASLLSKEATITLIKRLSHSFDQYQGRFPDANCNYKFEFGEFKFIINGYREYYYHDNSILDNLVLKEKELQDKENLRIRKMGDFSSLEFLAETIGEEFIYGLYGINCKGITYPYTDEGFSSLSDKLENIKQEKAAAAAEAAAKKAAAEAAAKDAGYPAFSSRHRIGAATAQQKAWVIRTDGSVRQYDWVDWDNPNRHRRDDDGKQFWERILPGELVVHFEKNVTASPTLLFLDWVPEIVTANQLSELKIIESWLGETYGEEKLLTRWEELLKDSTPSTLPAEDISV